MEFHLTQEKSDPRKTGLYTARLLTWKSVNPTHCHPKLCRKKQYIQKEDWRGFCTSVPTDPLHLTLVFSENSVPKLKPHMKLAKFAELGFTQEDICSILRAIIRNCLMKLIGVLLIARSLPGSSVEYRNRCGFYLRKNYLFLWDMFIFFMSKTYKLEKIRKKLMAKWSNVK